MRIFNHDENGYLIAEGIADADPLDADNWLIPAQAVTVEPPPVPEGQVARWQAGAWALEAIPEPPATAAPASAAAIRRGQILGRLAEIDIASIRSLRAKAAGKGKAFDDSKLAALDAEADALRAELAGLGA